MNSGVIESSRDKMLDFLSEAKANFEYTQSLRRDFHAHPETGFHETRTAGVVVRELSSLGLEPITGLAETGIVATIEGGKQGPVLMLRADMDALPINEETGAPYASQNPGVMHACGHDGHTAILLTVAKMLVAHRNELPGTVKLMFQPAEEGMGGAEKMIEAGILENPHVDMAIGLHLWNEKPFNWFGIASGPIMAGAEIFKIKISGKGGHAAAPHLSIDPVLASAQTISALQSIVSRNVDPMQTAVLSVCTIHGGDAFNVMPSSVELSGTIRTFDSAVRELVIQRMHNTVRGIAEAMGCQSEITLELLTPATINQANITKIVWKTAQNLFSDSDIDTTNQVTMGSEDFAFILEKVPGCFFFVGSSDQSRGLNAGHHHPKFDFDECALASGAALMTASTFQLLNNANSSTESKPFGF